MFPRFQRKKYKFFLEPIIIFKHDGLLSLYSSGSLMLDKLFDKNSWVFWVVNIT